MYAFFAVLFTIYNLVASITLNVDDVLPDLPRCQRNKQLIEICIQDSINSMYPSFLKGIPQLDIPSYEPYAILHYEVNLTEPSNGLITFKDMLIHGLTNYNIRNVRINADMSQIHFTAFFTRITTIADYKIYGTLVDIFIKKEGRMAGIIYQTNAVTTIDGAYYTKNNKSFFQVNKVKVSLGIGDVYFDFNRVTNYVWDKYFIQNQEVKHNYRGNNWRTIFPQMVSQLELIAADFIKTTANKIFSKFPMTALLPN